MSNGNMYGPDKKVSMIADARLRQDGEWFRAGQPFECSEGDAADLKAMGMAHYAPTGPAAIAERIKRKYQRKDLVAE